MGNEVPSILKPTVEDIPQLLDLWKEQYDFHHSIDPEYYAHFTSKLRATLESDLNSLIQDGTLHILVAKDNDVIYGFITFEKGRDNYYDANIQEFGVLKEILVTKNNRGSGIGKALVQAAEDYFKEQGIFTMMIQCSSFNPDALAVYHALGYTTRQELLYRKIANGN